MKGQVQYCDSGDGVGLYTVDAFRLAAPAPLHRVGWDSLIYALHGRLFADIDRTVGRDQPPDVVDAAMAAVVARHDVAIAEPKVLS